MPRRNHTPPHQPYVVTNDCTAKRRFNTEALAKAAADHQMLIQSSLSLYAYRCDRCPGWHLTRSQK